MLCDCRKYECCSVVSQFYQGYINASFLGKIKKKVVSCAEHLESSLNQQQEQEDEDKPPNPQVRTFTFTWTEVSMLYTQRLMRKKRVLN